MKSTPLLLLLTFALLLLVAVSSEAEDLPQPNEKIVWQRAYFPPVTIPEGEHTDEGFFDKVMITLIQGLPEYEHNFQTANFNRIMLDIEQQKNVCCPSLYKIPERENMVAFSIPAMIVLPNGIITTALNREKLTPYLDESGKISLVSLLKNGTLTLGISNGRKYSGEIDDVLRQFGGQSNLLVRSGKDVFGGLLTMMQMGRIDCLLGYPIEAAYFARNNRQLSEFVYFPVKENSITFTVGYIGCPNNSWGRNIISMIDPIIREHRETDFIDFYGQWLDEGTRAIHKKIATEYFKSSLN